MCLGDVLSILMQGLSLYLQYHPTRSICNGYITIRFTRQQLRHQIRTEYMCHQGTRSHIPEEVLEANMP